MKAMLDSLHDNLIFRRRVRVLGGVLKRMIPAGSKVLDVGCGDGQIAAFVARDDAGTSVSGIDVMLRPQCHIPVAQFDGITIPYETSSFDVVMFVDVLHHAEDPLRLLQEAVRVTRKLVLIKDHYRNGIFASQCLRLMDWVGNASKNVVLPYNYLSQSEWMEAYRDAKIRPVAAISKVPLYPPPFSWIFGRSLHFVTLLEKLSFDPTDS